MKVTYSEDGQIACFDGIKFRRDAKTGYYLATKKTFQGRRERLHVYVWRHYNGEIPEGYHVHHRDENKSHNDIENLTCIDQSAHLSFHQQERAETDRDRIIENLNTRVRPYASAWHRSEAGRKWHSMNAKRHTATVKEREYCCQYCGETFYKKPLGKIVYCSNKCRAAARRKSGVDNECRKCECCGKEFECNKYSAQKYCSEICARTVRWNKGDTKAGRGTCLQHGS